MAAVWGIVRKDVREAWGPVRKPVNGRGDDKMMEAGEGDVVRSVWTLAVDLQECQSGGGGMGNEQMWGWRVTRRKPFVSQWWSHTPLILALGSQRQADLC